VSFGVAGSRIASLSEPVVEGGPRRRPDGSVRSDRGVAHRGALQIEDVVSNIAAEPPTTLKGEQDDEAPHGRGDKPSVTDPERASGPGILPLTPYFCSFIVCFL
jgi:hypothetical protein